MWPILKGLILLRAVRVFHNGQFDLLHPNDTLPLADSAKIGSAGSTGLVLNPKRFAHPLYWRRKFREGKNHLKPNNSNVLETLNELSDNLLDVKSRVLGELPLKSADVMIFNASISSSLAGRYVVQQHIDPLRVMLGEQNLTSTCFILDHDEDAPFSDPHLVPGVYGFKKSFARLQTGAAPNFQLVCSTLPGFDDFWMDAGKIVPLQCLIEPAYLQTVYNRTYSAKRLLYQYIKSTGTKAVILSAYYGILGWAASAACKALDVPLVDVQHGVAGPGHESYDFRHLESAGYNTLPTHFLCWTKYDAEHLNSFSNGSYEALNMGQSWKLVQELMASEQDYQILSAKRIEEARVSALDTRQALQFKKTSFVAHDSMEASFSVLVALQNDADLEWASDLVKSLPPSFTFYFRLHPGTVLKPDVFASLVEQYETEKTNIKIASTATLDILMPFMDCVVTKYSSIVLDSHAFGKPAICYGEGAKWYFQMLQKDQPTYSKSDIESIAQALRDVASAASTHKDPERNMPLLSAAVATFSNDLKNNA